jgi:hypothetical protein
MSFRGAGEVLLKILPAQPSFDYQPVTGVSRTLDVFGWGLHSRSLSFERAETNIAEAMIFASVSQSLLTCESDRPVTHDGTTPSRALSVRWFEDLATTPRVELSSYMDTYGTITVQRRCVCQLPRVS